MGFFGKLFGSDKAIESGLDLIDNAFYTDEEKGAQKTTLLKLYEPFKLAQRYIAMTFCPPYMLAWFITFIASFFMDVTKQLEMLLNPVGVSSIVLAIVVFYFGGGTLNSFKNKSK